MRRVVHGLILFALLSSAEAKEMMRVHMFGSVGKPGQYELPTDSGVINLISLAGGITCNACPAHLMIRRESTDGRQAIEVNAYEIVMDHQDDIALQAGDVVFTMSHYVSHLECREIRAFNESIPGYLKQKQSPSK